MGRVPWEGGRAQPSRTARGGFSFLLRGPASHREPGPLSPLAVAAPSTVGAASHAAPEMGLQCDIHTGPVISSISIVFTAMTY